MKTNLLKKYIKTEVYLNTKNIFKKIYLKYFNENTNAVFLIRKMLTSKNRVTQRYIKRKLIIKYGIYVQYGAVIDLGLTIEHPHGIFISQGKIGKNCKIFQDVTLGRKHSGKNEGCPIIGDNVTIYSGAKVIGNVKIGNNVIIGANSVVTQDVPENTTVVGNPARIVKMNTQNN